MAVVSAIVFWMVKLASASQSANAFSPMLCTPLPTITLVNPVYPNAQSPISATLSGIVTLVKFVQPSNASSPIFVTPLPIVTLVKPLQCQNAYSPMLVTSEPISSATTFVMFGIYVVGVLLLPLPLLLISPVMLTVRHSVSFAYLYQVSA